MRKGRNRLHDFLKVSIRDFIQQYGKNGRKVFYGTHILSETESATSLQQSLIGSLKEGNLHVLGR